MSTDQSVIRREPMITWKKKNLDENQEHADQQVSEVTRPLPKIQWKMKRDDDNPQPSLLQDYQESGQSHPTGLSVQDENSLPLHSDSTAAIAKAKSKFGTREISDFSANIQVGCSNNCVYCWAAHRAISGGYVKSREAWGKDVLKTSQPDFNRKHDGVVMYPTTHDITRRLLNSHCQAISEILEAGNELVICSKARLDCMQKLAKVCAGHKDKVTFMVTITTLDEAQSVFWEPNAPLPCERLAALKFLFEEGFKTSVIIEPLLQGPCSALSIYEVTSPNVTEAIWIGTMNMIDERVDVSDPHIAKAVEAIKRYHSIDNLRFLYENMKELPKVRFKSSITRIFEKDSQN